MMRQASSHTPHMYVDCNDQVQREMSSRMPAAFVLQLDFAKSAFVKLGITQRATPVTSTQAKALA